MKKLFFILGASLLLTSCGMRIMAEEEIAILDYSRYTNQGFFLTESKSVKFDYQEVGPIYIRLKNGDRVKGNQIFSGSKRNFKLYETVLYTSYDAMDKAMEQTKSLGGNGIIKMNIEKVLDTNPKSPYFGNNTILTGIMIKRLDK